MIFTTINLIFHQTFCIIIFFLYLCRQNVKYVLTDSFHILPDDSNNANKQKK